MKQKNRPDMKDDRPKGVLFSREGATGWGWIRNLDYKEGKKEGDFSHLHDKFADPEDVA